jgi:hypothetical protein
VLELPVPAEGQTTQAQPRVLFDNFVQVIANASADLNVDPAKAAVVQLSVQGGRENPFLRIMLENQPR